MLSLFDLRNFLDLRDKRVLTNLSLKSSFNCINTIGGSGLKISGFRPVRALWVRASGGSGSQKVGSGRAGFRALFSKNCSKIGLFRVLKSSSRENRASGPLGPSKNAFGSGRASGFQKPDPPLVNTFHVLNRLKGFILSFLGQVELLAKVEKCSNKLNT